MSGPGFLTEGRFLPSWKDVTGRDRDGDLCRIGAERDLLRAPITLITGERNRCLGGQGRRRAQASSLPSSVCGPVPQALVQTPALSPTEWESQPQISTDVRAFNPLVRPFENAQKDFCRG